MTYLHDQPAVMNLLRYIKEARLIDEEIEQLTGRAQEIDKDKRASGFWRVSRMRISEQ